MVFPLISYLTMVTICFVLASKAKSSIMQNVHIYLHYRSFLKFCISYRLHRVIEITLIFLQLSHLIDNYIFFLFTYLSTPKQARSQKNDEQWLPFSLGKTPLCSNIKKSTLYKINENYFSKKVRFIFRVIFQSRTEKKSRFLFTPIAAKNALEKSLK